MLPRPHRLTQKSDFEKVYQQGRAVGGRFLLVKSRPNQLGQIRVGVVVSRKTAQKANQRNKIRRRVRQIIRSHVLSSSSSFDLVVICRPSAQKATYQEMNEDWQSLWLKLNL